MKFFRFVFCTWAAGGGYFGVFKHDQIRYTITGGKASVNMKFYGTNENTILKNGVNYNLDGWGIAFKNAGVGLLLDYDSRDNIFTPSDGVLAEVSALYYKGEGLLSKSLNYQIIDAGVKYFREIIPGTVLGWRIRGELTLPRAKMTGPSILPLVQGCRSKFHYLNKRTQHYYETTQTRLFIHCPS